jgi:hypothetical protein
MASKVGIANAALIYLGAATITAFTDDNDRARLISARYDDIRDAVIQGHNWSCAMKRQELAQSVDAPVYGYDYAYQLPADCLRAVSMSEGLPDGIYPWVRENRLILTDSDSCFINYIRRIEDPNEMDPLLREAISARLAAELSYKITGSKTMKKEAWDHYALKLIQAEDANVIEGVETDSLHEDEDDDLLSLR